MGKRFVPRQMTTDEVSELRETIAKATWEVAKTYKDAPHSYIIKFRSGPEWGKFAGLIKHCGTYRTWKGHRYKYLVLDGKAYWVDWPALNRADAATLDGYKVWGSTPSNTSISSNQP